MKHEIIMKKIDSLKESPEYKDYEEIYFDLLESEIRRMYTYSITQEDKCMNFDLYHQCVEKGEKFLNSDLYKKFEESLPKLQSQFFLSHLRRIFLVDWLID